MTVPTALVAAVVAALANVFGAVIVARREWSRGALDAMIAFSGGFLIAVALVEMLPESLAQHGAAAAWVILGGYLAVHLTQHTLVPHFHFGEETHHVSHSVAVSALIGLLLHMFVDGVAIASGFLVSGRLGVLLFLAVFLHKLPEGVTIASVTLAGGGGRRRALAAAAALGLATILGVLLTEVTEPLVRHGLAISAGVTLYVAASDLVPEFQAKRGWPVAVAFFGGAAAFLVTQLLLGLWVR